MRALVTPNEACALSFSACTSPSSSTFATDGMRAERLRLRLRHARREAVDEAEALADREAAEPRRRGRRRARRSPTALSCTSTSTLELSESSAEARLEVVEEAVAVPVEGRCVAEVEPGRHALPRGLSRSERGEQRHGHQREDDEATTCGWAALHVSFGLLGEGVQRLGPWRRPGSVRRTEYRPSAPGLYRNIRALPQPPVPTSALSIPHPRKCLKCVIRRDGPGDYLGISSRRRTRSVLRCSARIELAPRSQQDHLQLRLTRAGEDELVSAGSPPRGPRRPGPGLAARRKSGGRGRRGGAVRQTHCKSKRQGSSKT